MMKIRGIVFALMMGCVSSSLSALRIANGTFDYDMVINDEIVIAPGKWHDFDDEDLEVGDSISVRACTDGDILTNKANRNFSKATVTTTDANGKMKMNVAKSWGEGKTLSTVNDTDYRLLIYATNSDQDDYELYESLLPHTSTEDTKYGSNDDDPGYNMELKFVLYTGESADFSIKTTADKSIGVKNGIITLEDVK